MFKVGDKLVLSCGTESTSRPRSARSPARGGVAPFTLPTTSPPREEVDAVLEHGPRRRGAAGRRGRASATGVATPATSPTPTASAGRSPSTPDPSDRRCCRERPHERRSAYPEVVAEEASTTGGSWSCASSTPASATGSFATGLELVTRIAEAADEANHHPDVDADLPPVDVDLHSHDVTASPAATSDWPAGSARSPPSSASRPPRGRSRRSSSASTPPTREEVKPFWAACWAFEGSPGRTAHRPATAAQPTLWFQESAPRGAAAALAPRHLGARREVAEARIAAAVAPAARWSRRAAPAFWVLADGRATRPASARQGRDRAPGVPAHMRDRRTRCWDGLADSVDVGRARRRR